MRFLFRLDLNFHIGEKKIRILIFRTKHGDSFIEQAKHTSMSEQTQRPARSRTSAA